MSSTRFVFASLFCASMIAAIAADEARIAVKDGVLCTEGLSEVNLPSTSSYKVIPGPRDTVEGVMAPGESPAIVRGVLSAPLDGKGSLMFWFRSDRAYQTGEGQKKGRQKLLELPGALTVAFEADGKVVALVVEWAGDSEEQQRNAVRIQLPEFPGPEWHHFALYWNGPAGDLNAYLDGTPYYVAGEKMEAWAAGKAAEVVLPLGRFGVADVRVGPEVFSAETLSGICGELAGCLDALLGAKDLPAFSSEADRGESLYNNALSSAADIRDWKLEGPGVLTFAEGWMTMKSERPDGPEGHFVLWCPKEFPADFQAEWDFEILDQHGLCIVFFAARGQRDKDIFDPSLKPRNGIFGQYTRGDIDCYHISYFANTPGSPRPVANLRKNSGFYLVSNGPVGISPVTGIGAGKTHHAVLRKEGPRIRMSVDGRTIIDFTDDGQRAGPVWGGGKIGLRQMQWTVGRYRNFRVHALAKPAAN